MYAKYPMYTQTCLAEGDEVDASNKGVFRGTGEGASCVRERGSIQKEDGHLTGLECFWNGTGEMINTDIGLIN